MTVRLFLLLAIGISLVACNNTQQENEEWIGFESNLIKMAHPVAWTPVLNDNQVIIYSPKTNDDSFNDNISIFINYTASDTVTLDDYTKRHLESIPANFKGVRMEPVEDISIAGSEGKQMYFQFTLPEEAGKRKQTNLKFWQVWFIRDDMSYLLAFMAEKERFDELYPTAEKIVMSLETK